jgi:hypothetical protein
MIQVNLSILIIFNNLMNFRFLESMSVKRLIVSKGTIDRISITNLPWNTYLKKIFLQSF